MSEIMGRIVRRDEEISENLINQYNNSLDSQKEITRELDSISRSFTENDKKINDSALSLREMKQSTENLVKTIAGQKEKIELLKKIAKPQLLVSVFSQKQQSEVQQYIVEQAEDKSQHEKLSRSY